MPAGSVRTFAPYPLTEQKTSNSRLLVVCLRDDLPLGSAIDGGVVTAKIPLANGVWEYRVLAARATGGA
jgi:hypothetical protein